MNNSFGNIGDAFPETEIKCRIRGCSNRIILSGKDTMSVAAGAKRAERMCDECMARLQTLEDKEMPCSTPGCEGKWIWNKYQQLEATAGGRTPHPKGFCKECQEKMKNVQDKQIPCRIKGCKNTWTLTAREQQLLGDAPVPTRMCDECYKILNTLQDKEIKCRIHNCDHKILWTRFHQLEHYRAGKALDSVPSRLCDSCYALFRKLSNREIPCRIKGCKNTWTFTVNEQVEQIAAGKSRPVQKEEAEAAQEAANAEAEKDVVKSADAALEVEAIPPNRMCNECYDFFKNAVDIEEPCRNKSCKNTWTLTRSMQLAQKHFPPSRMSLRYCSECAEKLKDMEDKQMPCSQKGCDGTWTYTKDEQLRDQTGGREPQKRRCKKCNDFIAAHPAIEVECEKCGAKVSVSSMQQLECELGLMGMPKLCAECNRQLLQDSLGAAKKSEPAADVQSEESVNN